MNVLDTQLDGVKQLELSVFHDGRGYFLESYQARKFSALPGMTLTDFVQDNCSMSRQGVLRGLHYQVCHPQGKLVRVVQGSVFDVTVDMRAGSPQFGQWQGLHLSQVQCLPDTTSYTMLWIPPGYAHGFLVLSPTAVVEYKCTDYYHPEDEACLRWDDPDLAIAWPEKSPVLSDKDSHGLGLKELQQAGVLVG